MLTYDIQVSASSARTDALLLVTLDIANGAKLANEV